MCGEISFVIPAASAVFLMICQNRKARHNYEVLDTLDRRPAADLLSLLAPGGPA